MARALYRGVVIAESEDTVVVEGNHYFPRESLNADHFRASDTQTTCPWKGRASYLDVVVGADVNRDAAWTYPETKPEAERVRGRVAFWRGVTVEP